MPITISGSVLRFDGSGIAVSAVFCVADGRIGVGLDVTAGAGLADTEGGTDNSPDSASPALGWLKASCARGSTVTAEATEATRGEAGIGCAVGVAKFAPAFKIGRAHV